MIKIDKLISYLKSGTARTKEAKMNVFLSFGNRGLSVLINLFLVPLTINFINPTQYGIWLTISSLIQWITFFDFGFAHGFRNKFAQAKANSNIILAKQYVSTTYAILIILFSSIFLIFSIVNNYIDWSELLNIPVQYKDELHRIVFILILSICVQLVANIFSTLLLADQKPAFSSFILTFGQLFILIIIFILTKTTAGNLYTLSLVFSVVPTVITVVISIIMFRTKYKEVSPSINFIRFELGKDILGLGSKFFIIQLCMLLTLEFSNIILTRLVGPLAVTEYNISYKYFSILYMIYVIIFTPFWSAFTDASTKNDYEWMRSAYNKLFKIAFTSIPLAIIMFIIFPFVYNIWIGDSNVKISYSLSFLMSIYIILLIFANFFMSLINGTGKILLQTIIYLVFAIVSIPLMTIFCQRFSTPGVVLVPILVFLVQNFFGFIQLRKILNRKEKGIWAL